MSFTKSFVQPHFKIPEFRQNRQFSTHISQNIFPPSTPNSHSFHINLLYSLHIIAIYMCVCGYHSMNCCPLSPSLPGRAARLREPGLKQGPRPEEHGRSPPRSSDASTDACAQGGLAGTGGSFATSPGPARTDGWRGIRAHLPTRPLARRRAGRSRR